MNLTVANVARYVALLAAMAISFTTQRELALSHGVPVSVAFAVPLAIDAFMIWAVRTRRDVALSVAVAVAANVAGVLTAEPLSAVNTWVAAGLHAVFPMTLWRMHRSPSESRSAGHAAEETDKAASGPQNGAQSLPAVADSWPDDDLWQDYADTAPDSEDGSPVTPPTPADIRAAMAVLESRHGKPVTGQLIADHYGVSARTGRRYLAMAE
ncbi:transfer protein spdA [Streptomyces sp. NPDC056291]|uniref:transfer protein spdA n=1 Tax=Streptomyces sp. NPDC056291 TaxID=3345772 RepID=UPI0035D970FA